MCYRKISASKIAHLNNYPGFILADALNEQRLVGSFCDVIIKVGDKTFPAHRGVLCAASRYFQGNSKQRFAIFPIITGRIKM